MVLIALIIVRFVTLQAFITALQKKHALALVGSGVFPKLLLRAGALIFVQLVLLKPSGTAILKESARVQAGSGVTATVTSIAQIPVRSAILRLLGIAMKKALALRPLATGAAIIVQKNLARFVLMRLHGIVIPKQHALLSARIGAVRGAPPKLVRSVILPIRGIVLTRSPVQTLARNGVVIIALQVARFVQTLTLGVVQRRTRALE